MTDFYHFTSTEISQYRSLLESYHAIYRSQRLQQRQEGSQRRCAVPTHKQLQEIARHAEPTNLSPSAVMKQLQHLANCLRQYRIYIRSGKLPADSLDAGEDFTLADSIPAPTPAADEIQVKEFLDSYRHEFFSCLDLAIAKVTDRQAARKQKKQQAAEFLQALHLFHCQGLSMGEIAQQLGLQAQYRVTRLLQLKDYRADIGREVLALLRDRIFDLASAYTDLDRLHQLAHTIDCILEEQVAKTISQAQTAAQTAKDRAAVSLLAMRVCYYLRQKLR